MSKPTPVTSARVFAVVKAAAPDMDERWLSEATMNVLGDLMPGEGTVVGPLRLKRVSFTIKNVSAKDLQSGHFQIDSEDMPLRGVSLTDEQLKEAVQRRV